MERIVVPPPKLERTDEPGIGTAAGVTDIAGQRAVYWLAGFQKERVIVPWAGRRRCVMVFQFRRSGFRS